MAKSGPHRLRPKPTTKVFGPNFIKNWRIFRKMTVEELAEAAGMSTGNISAVENGRQGYSTKGLRKLAQALKTTPEALLGVDPLSEGTADFWPLWQRASAKDRQFLTDMADRLVSQAKR